MSEAVQPVWLELHVDDELLSQDETLWPQARTLIEQIAAIGELLEEMELHPVELFHRHFCVERALRFEDESVGLIVSHIIFHASFILKAFYKLTFNEKV